MSNEIDVVSVLPSLFKLIQDGARDDETYNQCVYQQLEGLILSTAIKFFGEEKPDLDITLSEISELLKKTGVFSD